MQNNGNAKQRECKTTGMQNNDGDAIIAKDNPYDADYRVPEDAQDIANWSLDQTKRVGNLGFPLEKPMVPQETDTPLKSAPGSS